MKAAVVRARVDVNLKSEVQQVLDKLGLTVSEAINLFLAQIKLKKGIPFDIKIPNHTTLKTFQDTNKNRNLFRCKNAKDIFDKLGI